jgi:type IV secretion system protein VirB8
MGLENKTFVGDGLIRKIQSEGLHKIRQERSRAFLLVGLLLVCICFLVVAIVVLSRIHTVIPVVSVIDANGHVVKQDVIEKETIMAEDSFVQSQIYNFIVYCNTFDPPWRQHYSDLCRLHATEEVARQYDAETSPDNPENPYYQIGNHSHRYPKITGMTKLGNDAYQVSFQSITASGGKEKNIRYYTGLVRYAFTAKALALGDRWENPLGFAATAYRKDQELSRK